MPFTHYASRITGVSPIAIAETPPLHPPDGDQIVQAFEQPIADAVLGLAMGARIVPHGSLGDRKAMHKRQRREEPMHPFEQLKTFDDGATENFQ